MSDRAEIREVVDSWALWRDAGDWERFATVWARDGWMSATWFDGPATDFIQASREGVERGVNILHFLGGTTVDVAGERAIAQTKMTILQRAVIDGVEVDVDCIGRFYDFFVREDGAWRIARRQPIYEKDRLFVLDPAAGLLLEPRRLAAFPAGYRHLAYVQSKLGFDVRQGLPGLTGEAVARLYAEGRAWLAR
jgi:hypothetical protein